jgi:hypothetical protein
VRATSAHRQSCNLPYIPVEDAEQAVVRHYFTAVWLPADFLAQVRADIDEAVNENASLSAELRRQYARRLEELDRKEGYLLDLAAEEGWPKDKLRETINATRTERRHIERTLDQNQNQIEIGRRILLAALDLLDNPGLVYQQDNGSTRAALNRAFFKRLEVDENTIADHKWNEPFDALANVHRQRSTQRSPARSRKAHASLQGEDEARTANRGTLIDSLATTFRAAVLVRRSWWS